MSFLGQALPAAALAVLASSVGAQGIQYAWPVAPGAQYAVASAGDVDADGVLDFLVGEVNSAPPSTPCVVRVHSGRTGGALLTVPGVATLDGFGRAVAGLGDVDGDGRADFAAGAPSAATPFVRAHSGVTGAVLWRFDATTAGASLGGSLAAIGDVDGDARIDLAVGAPSTTAAPGSVVVLSGATGAVVRTFAGVAGASRGFGVDVAAAGDLDADGFGDVLVGDDPADFSAGRVTVHSARTGALLRAFADPAPGGGFGRDVAALGDVSGDGVPDFVTGSAVEPVTGPYQVGRVRVVSGADGSVLRVLAAEPFLVRFGTAVDRAGDHDGDGRADVLVAAGAWRSGCCTYGIAEARVYSSASGIELLRAYGQSAPGLATVPDANGDGLEDWLVPSTTVNAQLVTALAVTSAPLPTYVPGCDAKTSSQGCRPWLEAYGAPSATVGDDFVLVTRSVVPNALGIVLWSHAGAQVPFAGGTLCLATPIRRWQSGVASAGQPDVFCPGASTGTLTIPIAKAQIAATGIAPGGTLHVQCWFRDAGFVPPNDVGLSGALLVTIWP